jgi:lipoprotein-anchoring transpeptidase ErfK/SrfK
LNRSTKLLIRGFLAMSLMLSIPLSAQSTQQCHWWQFRCEEKQIEGLPADAPRTGTVITIDVGTNRLYLFKDGRLVDKSLAATGSEKLLKQGDRAWFFKTPQGHLKVLRKIEDPVWTKPDWAFIEAGEPVPPLNSPLRKVKGHLGKYALDLGDGIMIHGTDQYDSIGRKASHGCIRLPNEMLETLYNTVPIGTDVYIFETKVPRTATKKERHSDLD